MESLHWRSTLRIFALLSPGVCGGSGAALWGRDTDLTWLIEPGSGTLHTAPGDWALDSG